MSTGQRGDCLKLVPHWVCTGDTAYDPCIVAGDAEEGVLLLEALLTNELRSCLVCELEFDSSRRWGCRNSESASGREGQIMARAQPGGDSGVISMFVEEDQCFGML